METRASYVLVGSFVMLCLFGLIVAMLWLTGSQYRQEFAYYRTIFTGGVTGLGDGHDRPLQRHRRRQHRRAGLRPGQSQQRDRHRPDRPDGAHPGRRRRLYPEPGFHRRHLPRDRRRQRELAAADGAAWRAISGDPLAAQYAATARPGRTGARCKLQHGRRAGERSPERPKSQADRGVARHPRGDFGKRSQPPPMSSSAGQRISTRRWRIFASPALRSPRRSAMSTTRSPARTARSTRPTRPWPRSTPWLRRSTRRSQAPT